MARARACAAQWETPFVPRARKQALAPLLETVADAAVVFARDGATLWDREGRLKWGPGMAALRLLQLERGATDDTFLRVAGLRPGESVLDCTLGLGQDALVAARAVGEQGRVVGCEMSLPLFAVVSCGLLAFDGGAAACRVEPIHAEALAFLKAQAAKSFDCVVFDPMFGRPQGSSGTFEALRRFASHAPLTPAMLEEARRVARRTVVVKAARYSSDLKKLGLTAELGSRFSQVGWARVAP